MAFQEEKIDPVVVESKVVPPMPEAVPTPAPEPKKEDAHKVPEISFDDLKDVLGLKE
jgi:hypothetical protein